MRYAVLCLFFILSSVSLYSAHYQSREILREEKYNTQIYEVTRYDQEGIIKQVDFYAKNTNPFDVVVRITISKLENIDADYDTDGTLIHQGEKIRIMHLLQSDPDVVGSYEFDWSVLMQTGGQEAP